MLVGMPVVRHPEIRIGPLVRRAEERTVRKRKILSPRKPPQSFTRKQAREAVKKVAEERRHRSRIVQAENETVPISNAYCGFCWPSVKGLRELLRTEAGNIATVACPSCGRGYIEQKVVGRGWVRLD